MLKYFSRYMFIIILLYIFFSLHRASYICLYIFFFEKFLHWISLFYIQRTSFYALILLPYRKISSRVRDGARLRFLIATYQIKISHGIFFVCRVHNFIALINIICCNRSQFLSIFVTIFRHELIWKFLIVTSTTNIIGAVLCAQKNEANEKSVKNIFRYLTSKCKKQ